MSDEEADQVKNCIYFFTIIFIIKRMCVGDYISISIKADLKLRI